jgi:hypothetical protein
MAGFFHVPVHFFGWRRPVCASPRSPFIASKMGPHNGSYVPVNCKFLHITRRELPSKIFFLLPLA